MIGLREVGVLRRAGLIPASRYLAAVHAVRDNAGWAKWARRALLVLGTGHLLAGIIFFIAHNWVSIPPLAKFGVGQALIAVAALAVLVVGFDRAAGRTLLIAASVLVGALLAVIGQVYQTGADAFELFTAWCA